MKKTPSSGKSLTSTYLRFFGWEGPERGWGGVRRLFEFEFEGEGGGVEVGAYARLDAYSNKYGMSSNSLSSESIRFFRL